MELAGEVYHALLTSGSGLAASPINLVSGDRSCFSHGAPTGRRLQRGDFGNIEYGATFQRYTATIGRQLTLLTIGGTQVTDLSSLQGMPLTLLSIAGTKVTDLSALRGVPLIALHCNSTPVSDLSPLEDCKSLTALNVSGTEVTAATIAALRKALPNCEILWDHDPTPD